MGFRYFEMLTIYYMIFNSQIGVSCCYRQPIENLIEDLNISATLKPRRLSQSVSSNPTTKIILNRQ